MYSVHSFFSVVNTKKCFKNRAKQPSQHFLYTFQVFCQYSKTFYSSNVKKSYANYTLVKRISSGVSIAHKIFTKYCSTRKCQHKQNGGNTHILAKYGHCVGLGDPIATNLNKFCHLRAC